MIERFEAPLRWSWSPDARAAGAGHGDHPRVLFTSREGGVSSGPWDSANIGAHVGDRVEDVLVNRDRAARLVGFAGAADVLGATQVHGADVWLDLDRGQIDPASRWSGAGVAAPEADALVSARPGIALAVGVADCLPVALVLGGAVAVVHAGWRGLERGVLEATLAVLRRAAGPSGAMADAGPAAVIGPALDVCCFEVGEEVAARFDPASVQRRTDWERPHLDARRDARRRLEALGVAVDDVDVCTACEPRLFSHRRDVTHRGAAATGRQAVLVRR